MRKPIIAALSACALVLPAAAQNEAQEAAPSPGEIVEAAAPEEWVSIPTEDLLVMTLAPDRDGNAREVVIQLMPKPFSQGWVDNIRLLARSGWYDGIAVIRVQDNYVTQWGDPEADGENAKPLPDGLKVMGESEYAAPSPFPMSEDTFENAVANSALGEGDPFFSPPLLRKDSYAGGAIHMRGWTLGLSGDAAWPTHCYSMVGVARGMSPNTGDGSSLYTVIGHAPRHLDRNIALVGRVIEGMEHLSSLPRGKGDLGFYADDETDKRTPILSVRVASDIAEFPQPTFEYLSTESETFARYAEARANRRDPFFIVPAGGADICNIPVPVRRVVTD